MGRAAYFGIAVFLVWAGSAMGATIRVPADYTSIQAAIDAAVAGDEIEVAPGTYYQAINFNGKAIRAYSSHGPGVTCIWTGSAQAVQCKSGEGQDTIIDGFTISGGNYFIGNDDNNGGGMYIYLSSPSVVNCVFSECGGYMGGAMYNEGGCPKMIDCQFLDNLGVSTGGIHNVGGKATVVGCTFLRNRCYNFGGAVLNHGDMMLANCVFAENCSYDLGSAITSTGDMTVVNCTFYSNHVTHGGGGAVLSSGDLTVANSIFWSNSPDQISLYEGVISVMNSNVQDGWPGAGNIDADPLFADATGGDFHLLPGSPCIDTGDNTAVTESYDFDGNLRIQGAAVDMGAYESTPTNQPPTILVITAPLDPTQINTAAVVGASFSDPDTGDSHTAQWGWGDGTSSAGVVDQDADTVTGSHTYATAGVYAVTLTVTDAAGDFDTLVYEFVVVYDPEAGFVTGHGWLDSPPGAYLPDPTLAGRANFGFVSRYQKGSTVPTGNTEFRFKTADLDFHSDTYDWLVVTGSDYAKFKGTGTINGSGDYKFQIWAGDEPDTFRIRIWEEDEATSEETVVYDNGFDQEIGGGSIVIHTK